MSAEPRLTEGPEWDAVVDAVAAEGAELEDIDRHLDEVAAETEAAA